MNNRIMVPKSCAPTVVTFLTALYALLLPACGQPDAKGVPVALPGVAVQCEIPSCRVDRAAVGLYAYWTTSTCAQPYFGAKILGVGSASCSVVNGCRGTVRSWADMATERATMTAPTGSYALCTVLDLNGSWVSYEIGADSGDALGGIASVAVSQSTPAQTISGFQAKP